MDDICAADIQQEMQNIRSKRRTGFYHDTGTPNSVVGHNEIDRILNKRGIQYLKILKSKINSDLQILSSRP